MAVTPRPEDFDAQDWQDYETAVAGPALRGERATGQYAIAARRRRRGECPYAAA